MTLSPHLVVGLDQKSCYQLMPNNSSTSGVYSEPGIAVAGIPDPDEILAASGSGMMGSNSIRFNPDLGDLDLMGGDQGPPSLGLELEEEEESIYSVDEGIAGIGDIPENILLEDLVFADNITSCNKVSHLVRSHSQSGSGTRNAIKPLNVF